MVQRVLGVTRLEHLRFNMRTKAFTHLWAMPSPIAYNYEGLRSQGCVIGYRTVKRKMERSGANQTLWRKLTA